MDLAHRVKALRESMGLSQDELASKMGYKHRTSIGKIEAGRQVTQKIIVRLADALNTTPAYLMGWTDIDGNEIAAPDSEDNLTAAQAAIVDMLVQLTPEDELRAAAYIQALLDARAEPPAGRE